MKKPDPMVPVLEGGNGNFWPRVIPIVLLLCLVADIVIVLVYWD